MNWICELPDLWERLKKEPKKIFLYGMGNGADKILNVCHEKKIPIEGVFASDDFVRAKSFHGMPVRKWSDCKAEYGAENLTVLLCFGTSRPEVLKNILSIASEAQLFVPSVPAFGEGLFDKAYALCHRNELERARDLLFDKESKRIFDSIVKYHVTGDLSYLLDAVSDPEDVRKNELHPEDLNAFADLGAYTGDTVRELLDAGCPAKTVYAMEPDPRNFRKLSAYAQAETRATVIPIRAAAWNQEETLFFEDSGNRNASVLQNRSEVLSARPAKVTELPARSLDSVLNGARVDYVKYDVEGSEREALLGSKCTIKAYSPRLLVSLYHRTEDLFALPILISEQFPNYQRMVLRRFGGVPAWDINLYVS